VPVDVRSVDALSKQLERSPKQILATLSEMGVVVVDGLYNHTRYEAALSEPKWLRNKRNEWSLSDNTGLGAIKYVLDPLKINIVQHDMRVVNYLMLEGPSRKRQFVRVHYRNNWIKQKTRLSCCFETTGFQEDTAPLHTLFVCIEGRVIWHFSRKELREYASHLSVGAPRYLDGVTSRWNDREREDGRLHFWLDEDCASVLTSCSSLGI
jgi:hypothetical protein